MHLELLGWLTLALSGCVHAYQPMSGLHRPVVVDPGLANFQDVRLTVRCVPEDLLNAQDASALCRKVALLFENQGARVRTTIGAHGSGDEPFEGEGSDDEGEGSAEGTEGAPEPPERADLILELRARRVHEANNPLLWAMCIGTFTLVPAVTESTFAQDVVVRDGSGFLLASESLEGRLVNYFGLGSWVGNKLLDAVSRSEEDKITGDAFSRDLSADLYRQLSQIVFNAQMQWQILQQSSSGRAN